MLQPQSSGPIEPKKPQSSGKKFFLIALIGSLLLIVALGGFKLLTGKEEKPVTVASPQPNPTSLREPTNRLVPVDPGSVSPTSAESVTSSSLEQSPTTPTDPPTETQPSAPTTVAPPAPPTVKPTFKPILVGWFRNILAPTDVVSVSPGGWKLLKDYNSGPGNPLGGCSATPQVNVMQVQRVLQAGSGSSAPQIITRVLEKDKSKGNAIATMQLFRDTVSQCPNRAWAGANSTWTVQDSSTTPFGEVLVVARQPVQPTATDHGSVYVVVRYDYRIVMADYSGGASGVSPSVVDQLRRLLKKEVCANGTC